MNLKPFRDRVHIGSKIGRAWDPESKKEIGIRNDPAYLKDACDASLIRLQIETLDILFLHRVDPARAGGDDQLPRRTSPIRQDQAIGLRGPPRRRRAHAIAHRRSRRVFL
jgi:aryl-alcohol dehydrogenase-like predicted oxidoreductase